MKWARLVRMVDRLRDGCEPEWEENTKRPNGGQWDLTGFEEYSGDIPSFVGHHGCGKRDPEEELVYKAYGQYKFDVFGLRDKTPMFISHNMIKVIAAAARRQTIVSERIVDYLCETGYLRKEGGRYIPNIMVTLKSEQEKCAGIEDSALWQETCDMMRAHYRLCCDVIAEELPEFIKNDEHQIREAVSHCLGAIRGGVIDEALRVGYITYDENHWQGLGAYLVI